MWSWINLIFSSKISTPHLGVENLLVRHILNVKNELKFLSVYIYMSTVVNIIKMP